VRTKDDILKYCQNTRGEVKLAFVSLGTLEVLCDIRDQLEKIAKCASNGQFVTAEAL
jgi:hypothetical protein